MLVYSSVGASGRENLVFSLQLGGCLGADMLCK